MILIKNKYFFYFFYNILSIIFLSIFFNFYFLKKNDGKHKLDLLKIKFYELSEKKKI